MTATGTAPVVILGYPHGGTERLRAILARHPGLACTTGTGIIPLADQAAAAWRSVDARPGGPPSPLAISSVRALMTGLITAILAGTGGRRWCETAFTSPAAVAAFRDLYPATRFVCLHRCCPDVISEAVRASPWGLAGPAFAPYTAAYPGSTVAALTAYWTARTAELIQFAEDCPESARQVRYEDLSDGELDDDSREFLGLVPGPAGMPGRNDADGQAGPASGEAGPFPAGQVAPRLLDDANRLLRVLGYPPLGRL
jgi:hypothetical protein